MRSYLLFFILLISLSCNYNNAGNQYILIKHRTFKGTIFADTIWSKFISLSKNPNKIWAPNKSSVNTFEYNIYKILDTIKNNKICCVYDSTDIDYIKHNIDDYNRQYFGYIDQKDKFLYVIFYREVDKTYLNVPDSAMHIALGGGPMEFRVQYNISKKELIEININAPM